MAVLALAGVVVGGQHILDALEELDAHQGLADATATEVAPKGRTIASTTAQ